MSDKTRSEPKRQIELILRQLIVERGMTDVPGILESMSKAVKDIDLLVKEYKS